ncbi:MAG: hypothetical protein P4L53_23690 [Candidatus Obscuribacterales bacterium]|nr:hypothetical protein [Candidatus Obscuribacterales bacterium]
MPPTEIYVYLAISLFIGLMLGAPTYYWVIVTSFRQRLHKCWYTLKALEDQVRNLEQANKSLASLTELLDSRAVIVPDIDKAKEATAYTSFATRAQQQSSSLLAALVQTTVAVRVESAHLTNGALLARIRKHRWMFLPIRQEKELRAIAKSILKQADAAIANADKRLKSTSDAATFRSS